MSTIPTTDAALLAAQAKAGQAGVDAYNAAKTQLEQQRQTAVSTAMREAALRGAPVGAQESITSTVTDPYNQRIASVTQAAGAAGEAAAAQQQRMAAYNAAANASRGLIPGQIELAVAPIRAETGMKVSMIGAEGRREVDKINAQIRLLEAQAAAAAAKAAKGGGGGGGRGGGGGGGRTITAGELKSALAAGGSKNLSTKASEVQQTAQQVPTPAEAQWSSMAANYAGRSQQLEQAKAGGASQAILDAMVGRRPEAEAEPVTPVENPASSAARWRIMNQIESLTGQQKQGYSPSFTAGGGGPPKRPQDSRSIADQLDQLRGMFTSTAGTPRPVGGGGAPGRVPTWNPAEQASLDRLRALSFGTDINATTNTSPQTVAQSAFRQQMQNMGKPIAPDFRFPEAIRAPSGLNMMNPMTGESYVATGGEGGEVTTGSREGMMNAAQRLLEDPEAMQQAMKDYAVEMAEAGIKINPEDVINAIGGGAYTTGDTAQAVLDRLGGGKQRAAVEKENKTALTEETKAANQADDDAFATTFGVAPTQIPGVDRKKALTIAATPQFQTYYDQLANMVGPFTPEEDVQAAIESMVPSGGADYSATVRMLNRILASGGLQEQAE